MIPLKKVDYMAIWATFKPKLEKKIHSKKVSYIFSKKGFFYFFWKWTFLAPR